MVRAVHGCVKLRTAGSSSSRGENGKKGFAIVVGILMLMSVVGTVFFFNPSAQGVNFRFGGATFTQLPQGGYSGEINGREVGFFYRPDDLSDIVMPPQVADRVSGSRAMFITYYWNSSLAPEMALFQLDFATLLEASHNVYAEPAFTTQNPSGLRSVTCANATSFVPVLLLQEANNTAIGSISADCFVLNATDSASFLRVSDKLKYALLEDAKR